MDEKKQTENRFVLVEVPQTFGLEIQDNSDGTRIKEQDILVEILNKLERIEKAVA